jgi:hypothetical protein
MFDKHTLVTPEVALKCDSIPNIDCYEFGHTYNCTKV